MSSSSVHADAPDLHALAERIKAWGGELGFQQLGITDVDLAEDEGRLARWLAAGHHGEMGFMAKHGTKRTRPAELVPGTVRVISVRLDYLPAEVETLATLERPETAYVSRYATGRDYHKLMRKRLATLAKWIEAEARPLRLPRLRRLGTGDGACPGAQGGARLGRQERHAAQSPGRLAILPGRAVYRPAAAGG